MRIAIVTETFLPSTDGIVTRLCATIQWLVREGHELLIIAPDLGVTEYAGARVEGIPTGNFFLYKHKKFSWPNPKVGRLLREFQPDLLHVVNPAFLGIAGIFYGKRYRLPLVASYHTQIPQYADYYRLPFLKPILWWYLRLLHNRADLNLCTSGSVKTDLDQHGFRNVHVWSRGVDLDRFNPIHANAGMRRKLTDGHPEQTLLLYVGRLASEKRLEVLLPVLDRVPNVRLAFVGDGPHREELERKFRGKNVVFSGFLHGEALSQAYASADAFIFPSTSETLGLVLLEAMAAGIPVLAARSGPTLEQVEEGKNGLLFEQSDTEDLIRQVVALQDADLRSRLAEGALSRARRFGWTKPSMELLGYYGQTISLKEGIHRKAYLP